MASSYNSKEDNTMKRIVILVIASVLAMSCNDFLDMQPTRSANASQAIGTPDDAQVALNGIMRSLTGASLYGRNLMLYGDVRGGDLTIYSAGRGLDGLYSFNHSATSNSFGGFWSDGFFVLMQVNNLIENIRALQAEGKTGFDRHLGSALTVRAMLTFDLVRLYGRPYTQDPSALGIPDVRRTLSAEETLGRVTVKENYAAILEDLKEGETLLSADKTQRKGYPGYYANLALQARVSLFMADYDTALARAKAVIAGPFSLYEPADWCASWAQQWGSESIFELGVDTEADLTTASLGYYYMCYHFAGLTTAMGWFLASDYFLNRLGEDPSDVRWGVMGIDESVERGESTNRQGACYKYVGGASALGDGKETRTAVNIKLIRLSEVYLIAAEAALNATTPDAEAAAGYLNQIRRRSPNLAPATAATVSDDMILAERSKELFGEGHRFFDQIRRGRSIEFNDDFQDVPVSGRQKVIQADYQRNILPIPQSEIHANPVIAKQQNPGY